MRSPGFLARLTLLGTFPGASLANVHERSCCRRHRATIDQSRRAVPIIKGSSRSRGGCDAVVARQRASVASAAVRDRTRVLASAALVLGGTLAGGNAVGIRFTNRELEPLFGAGARFALAAVLLLLFARARSLAYPGGRALLGTVVFGALNFAGAFGFGYYALVHIKAGVGSTLLALTPLVTLALAAAHRYERVRRDGIVGGVLAVVGVAVISNASLSGSAPTLAVLAAFASVICFAEAAVLVRRFPPVHPVMMNAVAMTVGAALLLVASAIARERWSVPQRAQTWFAMAYLVVAGSIAVFLLYLYVLRHWEASRAVYFDVMIPPVALALSAWLDEEPVSGGLVVGGTLVLVGAYVGAMRHADDAATT